MRTPFVHPAAARPPAAREAGFVLVGVVVVTLVLTILGISLFSLGSFEAQTAIRSQHEQAAFYAAVGGLERAKFALMRGDSLVSVKRFLPRQGVTYARAMQGTDSTGKVRWNPDSTVTLRVLGVDGNARKLLEARFKPVPGTGLYKHLYTSYGGVTVKPSPGTADTVRWYKTELIGNVWQNSPDTTWSKRAKLGSHAVYRIGDVPFPSLDAFFADHEGAAEPVSPGNSHNYELDADKNAPHSWKYYKTSDGTFTPYGGSLNGYTLDDTTHKKPGSSYPSIRVTGKSVWMFEHGVRFTEQLLIQASATQDTPAVVIVAKQSQDPANPGVGIWFRGAMSDNGGGNYCPVVLVSDGKVIIEHGNGTVDNSSMPYLNVYAREIEVMGPTPNNRNNNALSHGHILAASEDVDQGVINRIASLGLLPNVSSNGGGFRFVLTSWREVASSSGN
jgi:hypothetical protein